MVDHKYKELFWKSHVDKRLKIATDDGIFTAINSDIHWEDFELTESLCSESQLRFGSCEASSIKFQIRNAFIPLIGKWLTVTETLDGDTEAPFQYGRYKVFSDKPTADREYRDIIAYDSMYDIINTDVSAWYNSILPQKDSTVTLKQFRESFVRHFGLTEVLPKGGLANDNMAVERTIEPEEISGKDVITAICEINGCFGHIGRDGKFHYIYLPQDIQGLYPADFLFPDHVPEQWDYLSQAETGHLYPQDPKGTRMGVGKYIKCQYEDYVVRTINRMQIRMEENDIGKIWPETPPRGKENCYIIEDNFLVYGKSSEDLAIIAENVYSKIRGVIYRPFNAECPGNPCFEVGDPLRFQTKYKLVESYILKRTLKGIQALKDIYESSGQEYFSEKVNGVHKSIIQLKGKSNVLERTIEETRLEMKDIEAGLKTEINVTASGLKADITAERTRAEGEESKLSNSISVTAEGLTAKITAETERADGEEKRLSALISVTASELRTQLSNSTENLQSQITQNAGDIDLRVTKDAVVSAINLSPESITIRADRIDLQGLVNAQELTTKFATISTLNATTANLNNLISQRATITDLNATNLRVQNLELDHVSVSDLNAANARIDNLDANKINASTVYTDFMEVGNWTSAGHIRADRIDASKINAKDLNWESGTGIAATFSRVAITQNFMLFDYQAVWKTTKIGTTTITYLSHN